MNVTEIKYSATNTYLITGRSGMLLFDTGWAGTFRNFCRKMGEAGIPVQEIDYILISHFHPDHCGIAQEIADCGAVIAAVDVQREYIHFADGVFQKEKRAGFHPIDERKIRLIALEDSRSFLAEIGIEGEIVYTPGHSEDSISLCLDDGSFFVGDLNPLYELEMHKGTKIGESWKKLLERNPKTIYYGHAKTAVMDEQSAGRSDGDSQEYALVKRIMKYTDKGLSAEKIQKKTGAPLLWIQDVMRMYLTHAGVGVQGILDRMEIRGK